MTAVMTQVETPESIVYQRGAVYQKLNGFHAMLYRQMIWQYGKPEATERFWWLWHKKEAYVPTTTKEQRLI